MVEWWAQNASIDSIALNSVFTSLCVCWKGSSYEVIVDGWWLAVWVGYSAVNDGGGFGVVLSSCCCCECVMGASKTFHIYGLYVNFFSLTLLFAGWWFDFVFLFLFRLCSFIFMSIRSSTTTITKKPLQKTCLGIYEKWWHE